MTYKSEVQRKNKDKLQKMFDAENIPLFIQKYFIYLDSSRSAIQYWSDIRKLLLWFMENKVMGKKKLSDINIDDLRHITGADIIKYLDGRIEEGMKLSTVVTKKNVFSSFWTYLEETEGIQNIMTKKLNARYRNNTINDNLEKKLPSKESIKIMMEKVDSIKNPTLRVRNTAIIQLFSGSGIRELELAGLDLEDIICDSDGIYISILGKGYQYENQKRIIKITKSASEALCEWISIRRDINTDVEAVFITRDNKRVTEDNIKYMFRQYSSGEITPHMLRHYFATEFYRKSKHDVAAVQHMLGHKSPQTTMNFYAATDFRSNKVLDSM